MCSTNNDQIQSALVIWVIDKLNSASIRIPVANWAIIDHDIKKSINNLYSTT